MNKVILIGRLGKDPEIKNTNNGGKIANASLATSERKKNTEGVYENHTEWHRLVFFNKTADVVERFLKRGAQIAIEGKIQTREWIDSKNTTKYTTEIICNNIEMLGSKKENNSSFSSSNSSEEPKSQSYSIDDDLPF